MEFSLFYITVKDKTEALMIGKTIVSERIAACINIIDGMYSIYHWDGKICEENEAILLAKTRKELAQTLISRVKELHSYTCPCIVEVPLLSGNPDYLAWITQETIPHHQ